MGGVTAYVSRRKSICFPRNGMGGYCDVHKRQCPAREGLWYCSCGVGHHGKLKWPGFGASESEGLR
eukprot:13486851-Alexandrium_andersonii.AAC.1